VKQSPMCYVVVPCTAAAPSIAASRAGYVPRGPRLRLRRRGSTMADRPCVLLLVVAVEAAGAASHHAQSLLFGFLRRLPRVGPAPSPTAASLQARLAGKHLA
jgi:hypothetical protein